MDARNWEIPGIFWKENYFLKRYILVTFNIIERVIWIKINNQYGTGFTFDYNEKTFLITAKHVVKKLNTNSNIEIYFNKEWKKIKIGKIGKAPEPIDIAVLLPERKITVDHEISTTRGYFIGEDVFFLGFPYGLHLSTEKFGLDLPIPFVKKATISMVKNEKNTLIVFLDGHNNPGFSGGPVVRMVGNKAEIVSIISGYRFSTEKVYSDNKKTDYYIKDNTGIIISYGIKHAIEVMDVIVK